eukprot:PhF_6_TR36311/c0_g1_i10/m.53081
MSLILNFHIVTRQEQDILIQSTTGKVVSLRGPKTIGNNRNSHHLEDPHKDHHLHQSRMNTTTTIITMTTTIINLHGKVVTDHHDHPLNAEEDRHPVLDPFSLDGVPASVNATKPNLRLLLVENHRYPDGFRSGGDRRDTRKAHPAGYPHHPPVVVPPHTHSPYQTAAVLSAP